MTAGDLGARQSWVQGNALQWQVGGWLWLLAIFSWMALLVVLSWSYLPPIAWQGCCNRA
jgi:hypothetical protein